MASQNNNSKERYLALLQEIESDDELPDDYVERPETPAYLDDHRFDAIKFDWIHKYLQNNHTELQSNTQTAFQIESPVKKSPDDLIDNNDTFRSKGILRHQDLYCLKSVASSISSSTFVWFVNFLLSKDAQCYNHYLKSCLVNDSTSTITLPKNDQCEESASDFGKLEIVIKEKKNYVCISNLL